MEKFNDTPISVVEFREICETINLVYICAYGTTYNPKISMSESQARYYWDEAVNVLTNTWFGTIKYDKTHLDAKRCLEIAAVMRPYVKIKFYDEED